MRPAAGAAPGRQGTRRRPPSGRSARVAPVAAVQALSSGVLSVRNFANRGAPSSRWPRSPTYTLIPRPSAAARHPGRAALLRPVQPARPPAHRSARVGRWCASRAVAPQHSIDDLTAPRGRALGWGGRRGPTRCRARPGRRGHLRGAAQRVRAYHYLLQRLNHRRPLRKPCGAPARVDRRDGAPVPPQRSRRSSRRPVVTGQERRERWWHGCPSRQSTLAGAPHGLRRGRR